MIRLPNHWTIWNKAAILQMSLGCTSSTRQANNSHKHHGRRQAVDYVREGSETAELCNEFLSLSLSCINFVFALVLLAPYPSTSVCIYKGANITWVLVICELELCLPFFLFFDWVQLKTRHAICSHQPIVGPLLHYLFWRYCFGFRSSELASLVLLSKTTSLLNSTSHPY